MVLCVFTAAAETAYLSPDVNNSLQPTTVNTFCLGSEIQDGDTQANRAAQPTQGLETKYFYHAIQCKNNSINITIHCLTYLISTAVGTYPASNIIHNANTRDRKFGKEKITCSALDRAEDASPYTLGNISHYEFLK